MTDFLPVVRQQTERFAARLDLADPAAPVPSCPGWTVFDLADHLGGVHQWARHAIVHGTPDGEPDAAPQDGLADWYRRSARDLLSTLTETPFEAPAWHFGAQDPRQAGWWRRRQAHETTVHLWDLHAALGRPLEIDPVLAADGVAEVRDVFFPRQVRLGRIEPLPRSLAVVVAETGDRHLFAGAGDDPAGEPEATVTAPAEVLYLALWHRIPADDRRLRVEGDREAAVSVLSAQLTA